MSIIQMGISTPRFGNNQPPFLSTNQMDYSRGLNNLFLYMFIKRRFDQFWSILNHLGLSEHRLRTKPVVYHHFPHQKTTILGNPHFQTPPSIILSYCCLNTVLSHYNHILILVLVVTGRWLNLHEWHVLLVINPSKHHYIPYPHCGWFGKPLFLNAKLQFFVKNTNVFPHVWWSNPHSWCLPSGRNFTVCFIDHIPMFIDFIHQCF